MFIEILQETRGGDPHNLSSRAKRRNREHYVVPAKALGHTRIFAFPSHTFNRHPEEPRILRGVSKDRRRRFVADPSRLAVNGEHLSR
jgi:hypothetical protein